MVVEQVPERDPGQRTDMGGVIYDEVKSFRRDLGGNFTQERGVRLTALKYLNPLLRGESVRNMQIDAGNRALWEIVAPEEEGATFLDSYFEDFYLAVNQVTKDRVVLFQIAIRNLVGVVALQGKFLTSGACLGCEEV
jgi:hypothetical protein